MNLKSTGFEEGQHLVQFWWVALVGEDLMVEGHQTDSQSVKSLTAPGYLT